MFLPAPDDLCMPVACPLTPCSTAACAPAEALGGHRKGSAGHSIVGRLPHKSKSTTALATSAPRCSTLGAAARLSYVMSCVNMGAAHLFEGRHEALDAPCTEVEWRQGEPIAQDHNDVLPPEAGGVLADGLDL